MSSRLYLDVHVLQVLPPSCVNRDDVGMPKMCFYGGVERARVSSQAWKRAIRLWFREHGTETAIRTRRLVELLSEELRSRGISDDGESEQQTLLLPEPQTVDSDDKANKLAKEAMDTLFSNKKNKKNGKNNDKEKDENDEDKKIPMAFISDGQIKAIAEVVVAALSNQSKLPKDKKIEKKLLEAAKSAPTADILLFGRMYAANQKLNVDAAAQVAHVISTHEASRQYDYFTAVEESNKEDESGAGHIDSKCFSSSVVYRYATVNLGEKSELVLFNKQQAAEIAEKFLEAFVCAMPTGSINSYANNTLPFYVLAILRDDMPINFAPAFEKPIKANDDGGYCELSKEAFLGYKESVHKLYGSPVESWELGNGLNLQDMLEKVRSGIEGRL